MSPRQKSSAVPPSSEPTARPAPQIGDKITIRHGLPTSGRRPNIEIRKLEKIVALYKGRHSFLLDNGHKIDWYEEDGRLRTKGFASLYRPGDEDIAQWADVAARFDDALRQVGKLGKRLPLKDLASITKGLEDTLKTLGFEPEKKPRRAPKG